MLDCLVIGAGPAGLSAAVCLARLRVSCAVLDGGQSRAALIPLCRNFPAFPNGIKGTELLERLQLQLAPYSVEISPCTALSLELLPDGIMRVRTTIGVREARTVLLATGKEDMKPPMPPAVHDAALAAGILRYCPICDGYEADGKDVVVLGSGAHGVREALFIRSLARKITLVCPHGTHALESEDAQRLKEADIAVIDGPTTEFAVDGSALTFRANGSTVTAQAVYAALGCRQRSELAKNAGVALSDDGCIVVDSHQRTTVPGLYAGGDVILGVDQIAAAVGNAAVAATTIRNDLHAMKALRR